MPWAETGQRLKTKDLRDRLNRPLKDLRVSVTDRCNLRCPHCMPEDKTRGYSFLAYEDYLNLEEITRAAELCTDLGVRKIRITGGEPLLRDNITLLVKHLKQINADLCVALTTNGILLEQYAKSLKDAGLDRVTVSLNSMNPTKFRQMSGGRGSLCEVLKGIDAARDAGFSPIKINTVVQKGVNDKDLLDLVEYFTPRNCIVRFIEYMDVGTLNQWNTTRVVTSPSIHDLINARYPLVPLEPSCYGETAQRYGFLNREGEIGFISSVSQAFCRECTRLRLTADGKLHTCLFAGNSFDLKKQLREGAGNSELADNIRTLWQEREDKYSEDRFSLPQDHTKHRREMFSLGG